MNEIIYLETDEEITSVIDRLRKAKEKGIALVIPRGGTLAQSIVNLKLLKKSAQELGKEISLVSNDRISRNLASQIGLSVFSKVSEAEKGRPVLAKPEIENGLTNNNQKGEFKVNSYYGSKENEPIEEDENEPEEVGEIDDTEEDSLIEKDLREKKPEKEKELEEDYKKPEFNRRNIEERKYEPRRETPKQERKPLSKKAKIIIGISVSCLIILLTTAYLFLPYASASVQVKTDDLDVSKEITVDADVKTVDADKLVVPGTVISVEKEMTKTYKTTGKKEIGEKATGKITVYNEWDDKAKTIPAGSKFISDDGKVYISNAEVSVPGLTVTFAPFHSTPGKIDVNVTAEQSGDGYNIGPSHFTIDTVAATQKSKIYGQSAVAMTGGTTKTLNVVSDVDLKNAENDLKKTIIDGSKADLIAKAGESQLKIVETKITGEILSKESSKNVNDESAEFDYKEKLNLTVLTYSDNDLRSLLSGIAESKLKANQMLINKDKFSVDSELASDQENVPTKALLKTTLKGKTGQKISDTEIKQKIKNKKFNDAKKIIESYDKVEKVNLEIWPSSIARVPILTSRIKIKFDYAN